VSSPLRSPRLRRIIAAYTINRLGTWIGTIALALAVFNHTRSSIAVAAVLVAGQVIPALAVPVLVARVEASPRRRELSGLYFFECAATSVLAVLLWHFWLPLVLLLVALDGTAALTASALLRAETARAAREDITGIDADATEMSEELEASVQASEQRANAALNIGFSASFVLGPVLAGAIVAGASASIALFLDAGSFLLCGVFLLDLHPHVEEAAGESVRARLRAAWRYINDVPALRTLLLIQALALVFFESAAPIEVAYAKLTLHAGDSGFGLLVTVWGAGVVLGSIVFARARTQPLGRMLSAGTFAVGLAYVGFAVSPSLALACVAALIGGVGNGMQWAPLVSAVQRLTPPGLHGRVMGALESIGALAPAVGLSLGGALVALSSPRTAFAIVGIGAGVTTIGFLGVPLARPPATASDQPDAGHAVDLEEVLAPPGPPMHEPSPH
jgi:MFS family permease